MNAMYENPSAEKFDPRPVPSAPHEFRVRGPRLFVAMLVLALLAARWLFAPATGWAAYLVAALTVALMILEWVLFKKEADEKGPYTEQGHLTR